MIKRHRTPIDPHSLDAPDSPDDGESVEPDYEGMGERENEAKEDRYYRDLDKRGL